MVVFLKNNPDEIGKMIGAMMPDTGGSLVVKPNGPLMESGDLVASPVRFSAAKGTQSIDMTGIDLFEVQKGKITQVWLCSEDQPKEDEFWGKQVFKQPVVIPAAYKKDNKFTYLIC